MNALSNNFIFDAFFFFANNVWSSRWSCASNDCIIDRLGEVQIWPFLDLHEEKEFASRDSLLLQMEIVVDVTETGSRFYTHAN